MDNNTCPKQKRCKHGADCRNADTFRGEYLCFEGNTFSSVECQQRRYRTIQQHRHKKKGRRI